MKGFAAILLLAGLTACAGPVPHPPPLDVAVVQPDAVCRVGPNGGSVLAERGIGGTGGAVRVRTVERGIGGTGIVGVVTGFASVCVDGQEVRIDKSVPVTIDGASATAGQLRAGQLVAIEAGRRLDAPDSPLQARTIAVRYEVTGPIESIDAHADTIIVAGQRVSILPTTWVAGRFGAGSWTSISGLRQPDGTIAASRLDRARPGMVAVRGQAMRDGAVTRIGGLILHGPAAGIIRTGAFVSILGKYQDGWAEVTALGGDTLAENPVAYFGPAADRVVVQGFVKVDPDGVTLTTGQRFAAGPDVHGSGPEFRNAIVSLRRGTDGAFIATGVAYTNFRAQPKPVAGKSGPRGPGDVSPPFLPPWLPAGTPPAATGPGAPESGPRSPGDEPNGIIPGSPPRDGPDREAEPSPHTPSGDGAIAASPPAVYLAGR